MQSNEGDQGQDQQHQQPEARQQMEDTRAQIANMEQLMSQMMVAAMRFDLTPLLQALIAPKPAEVGGTGTAPQGNGSSSGSKDPAMGDNILTSRHGQMAELDPPPGTPATPH